MPLLWAMSPQQQANMQQGQKTLLFSYNMHLFLPYLLNDSQTIRSMIHFSKPLLCMLICGDWSDDCWSTACNLCRKWKAHQHYWILQHFTQQHEQTTWFQFYLINSSLSPTRKCPELLMNLKVNQKHNWSRTFLKGKCKYCLWHFDVYAWQSNYEFI